MTETPDTDTHDVVILVHGTFAADKSRQDTGHRWWQRDSVTWRELEARLPEGVRLPGRDVRLFHWSGANAQSERLKASNELLVQLIELERQGRGYHLVGHSHGGSVIWEALTTAAVLREQAKSDPDFWDLLARRKVIRRVARHSRGLRAMNKAEIEEIDAGLFENLQLRGLRSWTTVGTPFLRFLPRRRRFVDGWPHPAYSLADRERRTSRKVTEGMLFWTGLLLLMVAVFSVLLLISYLTAGSDPSKYMYSKAKPYRGSLLWPTLGLLGGFVGFQMLVAIYAVLTETLDARERASRAAFARHAGRWLGIWAPTDEAITLLRTVAPGSEADYRMLFTPRASRTAEPFKTDYTLIPWKLPLRLRLPPGRVGLVPSSTSHRPGSTYIAPVYFLFNRLVAPRIADQLSNTMVRTIQGSDISGAELVFASQWPIPLDTPPPGLPDDVAERLEARARSNSAELIPVSREIMAQAALGLSGVVGTLAAARAGTEGNNGSALVHTGYFEDPFVLDLIVEHIRRGCGAAGAGDEGDSRPDRGDDEAARADGQDVRGWLDAWAGEVAERLKTLEVGQEAVENSTIE